ncbi:hypothetical protein [Clostridium beijerinckii]|uniref:Uncharacterized protein n=1 Tax=Clostridium beijerinckii TaxID=1520 RepID=A0AAE5LRB4_CLOBE|nr:hypothetical protein [Clostridium beijerinckii]NSB15811.1 hypothetical protein [Clostridium beijerinckii]OOM19425.1 hypothetical protein CLOBE_53280 [Clostridium beijerinckii]
MEKVSKDTIKETIKELPKEQQKIILHLADTFDGEEETINTYMKSKLNK